MRFVCHLRVLLTDNFVYLLFAAVEEYDANSYSIDEQYEDSEGELALQYERLLDDDDDKNQTSEFVCTYFA